MVNRDGEGPSAVARIQTLKYLEIVESDGREKLSPSLIIANIEKISWWSQDDFHPESKSLYQSDTEASGSILDYDIDRRRHLMFVVNDRGHLFK